MLSFKLVIEGHLNHEYATLQRQCKHVDGDIVENFTIISVWCIWSFFLILKSNFNKEHTVIMYVNYKMTNKNNLKIIWSTKKFFS